MPNDPATVAGLRGRWRASTITSPPADGATLQTWTDTSGNGFNATQATAGLRPVYRTSGAFLPNSKPAVEFVAATLQEMTATVANNGATTRFAVFRLKTLTATQSLYGFASGFQMQIATTGKFRLANTNAAFLSAVSVATLAIDTWYVLTFSSNGSNSHTLWLNGTQDSTSTTASTPTATSLALGSTSGDEYLNGYLPEVLDYSAVLTAGERAVVHSYVQEEYGVTVSDYVAGVATGNSNALNLMGYSWG